MLAVPVRCTGVGERTPVRIVPAAASAVWIAPMTEPAPSSSASSRRIREPFLPWRSSRRWMTWRMASRIWALEAESTTMSGSRTAETVAMAKAVRDIHSSSGSSPGRRSMSSEISPAFQRRPRWTWPSRMSPVRGPRVNWTRNRHESASTRCSWYRNVYSPKAAILMSFSTMTCTPRAWARRSARGKPDHTGTKSEATMEPSGSTTPVAETPTASSRPESCWAWAASWMNELS